MVYQINEIHKVSHFFGRTIRNQRGDAEFFNWTCSGFETVFSGTVLRAEFLSISEKAPMTKPEIYEFPWIGVFLDGSDTPSQRIELKEPQKWYTLYQSDTAATHTMKIVKLSENARGKTGIIKIETDGHLELPVSAKPSCRLEFIGDSITCGYGNEASDRDAPFLPGEENGWITYAALAARKLGAEYNCVCVSGITMSNGSSKKSPFPFPAMEGLYEYTDRLYELSAGENPSGLRWDFQAHPVDFICINLGTNDVNLIKMAQDKAAEEQLFLRNYIKFIQKVRALNGPKAEICCTLGPLDYYLYDNIRDAVDQYVAQSGDEHVCCFKFGGVNFFTEGFGAVGHPSAKTHQRMADELTDHLRKLLKL